MRLEAEGSMLAELGEWIVTGVAGAGARLVARCSQMHLDDAVRLAWRLAQARHPAVDPGAWFFRCHLVGDGRPSVYYRVDPLGLFLLPLEVLQGDLAAPHTEGQSGHTRHAE
jgi:hypothetical protein